MAKAGSERCQQEKVRGDALKFMIILIGQTGDRLEGGKAPSL